MAETIAVKQQLIVMNRSKRRAPRLTTFDRFFFGFTAFFSSEKRIKHFIIIIIPATILRFYKLLFKRLCNKLYSNKTKKKPRGTGPDQKLIDLVIEKRKRIRISATVELLCKYIKSLALLSVDFQWEEY